MKLSYFSSSKHFLADIPVQSLSIYQCCGMEIFLHTYK